MNPQLENPITTSIIHKIQLFIAIQTKIQSLKIVHVLHANVGDIFNHEHFQLTFSRYKLYFELNYF